MLKYILLFLSVSTLYSAPPAPQPSLPPAPAPRYVVTVVWDGMRPDFVTPQYTPHLWKLASRGVTFRHHHPVYPSSTEVNGTAMATGDYPGHSGLMANREYRPSIDPLKAVGTELPSTIAAGGPRYLAVPTLVQTLNAAGLPTAVAGTKGVALLQDWSHLRPNAAARQSHLLAVGTAYPATELPEITGTLGPWPELIEFPNIPEDSWTTAALTQVFWKSSVPAYSLLWLSDPDYSQHQMAPGSPLALAAIKSADDRLGTVLTALESKGVLADTDIFVISDHGFSTIAAAHDPRDLLSQAGLKVTGTAALQPPQPGEILPVSNGGSVMFYITGHDASIGHRLVECLQKSGYAGVIFSRWTEPGTFSLDAGLIDTAAVPDVVMAFRWSDAPNKYGAPGLLESDSTRSTGRGSHASLSHFEMHNTLIAAGPDFLPGTFDDLPTGNQDLAPTVLAILGVPPQVPMDGRVLREAMLSPTHPAAKHFVETAENPATGWKQYLSISQVGTTEYLDEGNAGAPPK